MRYRLPLELIIETREPVDLLEELRCDLISVFEDGTGLTQIYESISECGPTDEDQKRLGPSWSLYIEEIKVIGDLEPIPEPPGATS